MRIDKTLSVGLVALLLMSMVMVGVNEVPVARLCVDIPCWIGWYPHEFVANVNVTDVQDLYSFEFKLAWDKTLLDLIGVNITSPEEWDTNYVIFKNETMQNYNGTHGRYWLNMSALAPAPSFNGSTILVELTFQVTYQPFLPEPDLWVCLNIYDTKLNNAEGLPISHEVYDGFLWIPSGVPCLTEWEVWPAYYEATTLGENFTVEIRTGCLNAYFDFGGWNAKLGYNTTLLDVLEVEEGSFIPYFRKADKRYFTANVNEEEGYINFTGGVLGRCATPCGWGTLAKVTFNATYLASCSENGMCPLDLYDANLTNFGGGQIPIGNVFDGLYQAPHPKLTGDINDDGIVDIVDIVKCALAFGSKRGEPRYDPECDINNDDIVDIVDLVIIAINFGCTC